MIKSKKLVFASVFLGVTSIILYCIILFQDFDVTEFDDIIFLLFPAQAFLSLTCILIVFAILTAKHLFNQIKIKVIVSLICVIVIIYFGVLVAFNYNCVYSCYTPNLSIKENFYYIQTFFPYHNIDQNQDSIDIEISAMSGTTRIIVSSRGEIATGGSLYYTADYFESTSSIMNLKFYLDKGVILPSDLIYIDAYTEQKKIEIDGVKITLFTKADGNDYGLFIRKANKAIYAEVDDVYNSGISYESFAKIIIQQFSLLEDAAKDGTLLEIPAS